MELLIKEKLNNMDNRLKWRIYNIAVWERVYDVKVV